ncbi:MAG: threonine--tRNA ligase, partial [Victivallales bacterium]|nr:threonine--tRNA ligase [Victivallales bacterium]
LKVKDAIGRERQTSTIQFDFNLPERCNLEYVGQDGMKHQPFLVHRALLGSLERFFGILVEHYAGAFPTWLAPEQVRVLSISEKHAEYAREVGAALRAAGIRCTVDVSGDPIGAKVKSSGLIRIPYVLVVGDMEAENKTVAVSVRDRSKGGGKYYTKDVTLPVDDFIKRIQQEIDDKVS